MDPNYETCRSGKAKGLLADILNLGSAGMCYPEAASASRRCSRTLRISDTLCEAQVTHCRFTCMCTRTRRVYSSVCSKLRLHGAVKHPAERGRIEERAIYASCFSPNNRYSGITDDSAGTSVTQHIHHSVE